MHMDVAYDAVNKGLSPSFAELAFLPILITYLIGKVEISCLTSV